LNRGQQRVGIGAIAFDHKVTFALSTQEILNAKTQRRKGFGGGTVWWGETPGEPFGFADGSGSHLLEQSAAVRFLGRQNAFHCAVIEVHNVNHFETICR
jgi:hypothetical protein